ncbi:AMP-binding protein [Nocardia terpenica]|uniref:carboxylic acid reductase n=1 Tax=Nocardia terpenica TaxID=455432 RepID=UPI002FE1BCC0
MVDERVVERIAELEATDAQYAGARSDGAVAARVNDPELRLPEVVRAALDGYADRPALGARAVEVVAEPGTGRRAARLTRRLETVTYRELGERIAAVAGGLRRDPDGNSLVDPGDRVVILGFTSIDYTVIDLALTQLGAVSVPLQASSSAQQLRPIVVETEPRVAAASIDHLLDAVELALTGFAPARLVVFDYLPEVDAQRELFETAADRLADSGVVLESLAAVADRGAGGFTPEPPVADDPLSLLIYTSGSTGAPKGAMYPESLAIRLWRGGFGLEDEGRAPGAWITLNFMPMSHVMGRATVFGTLGRGGIAYFGGSSDMSTFLEDLALIRPTQLQFVPRVWELLFQEYQRALDRYTPDEALTVLRRDVLGGRALAGLTGSAPISAEVYEFADRLLGTHVIELYGSTEAGGIFVDGRVLRPPVRDYKLVDVPDLGYYSTDRPYPRGELLLLTETLFPGYFRRPEVTAEVIDEQGYYHTGDVVAEVAPDELRYLDRRNNVLKLSQGEFVTVSKLEAAFAASPAIEQIYVYGNSSRPYLLAVVVPTEQVLAGDETAVKSRVTEGLRAIAAEVGLQSYEVPRDFLIETTPFTVENGLLTGIRKLARPKLKQHYGERLEQLYHDLAQGQAAELRALHEGAADRPTLETVTRAAAALLGVAVADVAADARFTDLGGDSLSALTFGNTLNSIFEVEVPVGVIVGPATDLRALAEYIEHESATRGARPTFASVHGAAATEVRASDLTLDRFIDPAVLAAAPSLPRASGPVRTVLLTGATGFLGRYLALEWLERVAQQDGTVICLVRATDDAAARERLDRVFDSGDPALWERYRGLAQRHLRVLAGDKGSANLGLDEQTWRELADTVDLIVDPAALVNHVLPYSELFGPNVIGTAELIRLALTGRIKSYDYISTVGVGDQIEPAAFTEDADVRAMSAVRRIDDSYANGYGNSKWAGEVLLREAHDLVGLPVAVFRCDMILADGASIGQLNLPDMFTRLMLSLVATGIAPESFYELDADGHRQRAHYDGLPVDFIAAAVAELGVDEGFSTYHVMNPHDDGIGLDQYVDWLVEAGYRIDRIADYRSWLGQFETKLRALPERQRKASLLPLLHNYQHPTPPLNGAIAVTDRFRAAVQEAKIGPDKDIPHVGPAVVVGYVTNLEHLGLL